MRNLISKLQVSIYTILILALFNIQTIKGAELSDSTSSDPQSQLIVYPWASVTSDEGLELGLTGGVARYPEMMVYSYVSWTTEGCVGITLRGERSFGKWRLVGEPSLKKYAGKLYPDTDGTPEATATASITRLKFRLAVMRKLRQELEIGPELIVDVADGEDAFDANDLPLPISTLSRFRYGYIAQLGPRIRYSTTSTLRPLDGVIIDAALRTGWAGGDEPDGTEFDFSSDLLIAYAQPVIFDSRIYLRGWWGYQYNTPPPNHLAIGGSNTLRGQSYQRYIGRNVLSGRVQYHYPVVEYWDFPMKTAHQIWHKVPTLPLTIEVVTFCDVGSVGDLDSRWLSAKYGYGCGLRFIFPPEMIFSFDIGKSPNGNAMFYMGVGETL